MAALRHGLLAIALLFVATLALAVPTTPTEDFTDNLDGTVTHRITGLTWMRCAMGMTWTGTTGTANTYTWDQATKLTANFSGKADWRLPTTSQGFGVLSEIDGGEGYWVNAKTSADLGSISGAAINLRQESLASGWNLMATASLVTPQNFNLSLSTTPPTLGQVPINLTSLWAWDDARANWYFYAPSLEAQGGGALADYLRSHNYFDFGSNAKTLGNGIGFWVKR